MRSPSGSAPARWRSCLRISDQWSEHAHVPPWATIVGGALLLLTLVFAVIGSAVVFTWLSRLLSMSDRGSRPPEAGLAGMRIGLEYGSAAGLRRGPPARARARRRAGRDPGRRARPRRPERPPAARRRAVLELGAALPSPPWRGADRRGLGHDQRHPREARTVSLSRCGSTSASTWRGLPAWRTPTR